MLAIRLYRVRPQNFRPYAANYQCLNIALNHLQSRAPHNKYFEIPHSASSIFTGREDICQDLQGRCLPSDPPGAQKMQKRYVLYGLGGSGKTQICLKFAQDHRERYDNGYKFRKNKNICLSLSFCIYAFPQNSLPNQLLIPPRLFKFFHVTSEFVQRF